MPEHDTSRRNRNGSCANPWCKLDHFHADHQPYRSPVRDPFHAIHHDAQDDQVAVGCYDVDIAPAVVFDGGGFTDSNALRAFATDLLRGADWMDARDV